MDLEKISKLIKNKRKEAKLTQSELAEKLNVTEKAISRWETGRGTPDISLLIPLSKTLNLDVAELLEGQENKKEEKQIEEIINYIEINKKSKNKLLIPILIIVYTILLFLYLAYLKIEYSTGSGHTYLGEIVINSIFAICIFIINKTFANNYYDKKEDKEKANKLTYIMLLVIYCILFFNLTIFGRNIKGEIRYNLIPFKTIIGFVKNLDWYNININLIGNIVILMPLQFIMMKIFNIKRFRYILLIDILLVSSIEILQHFTHTGVLDIDDIILNVLGMSMIYFIFKDNKINVKSILIILIFVIILIGGLFLYKNIDTNFKGKVEGVQFRLISNESHNRNDIYYMYTNIINNFHTNDFKGCKLLEVYYDEEKVKDQEYELEQETENEEIVVMSYKFKTGKNPAVNFNQNTTYVYNATYSINDGRIRLISEGV